MRTTVLVVYASRHGATKGIAERIAAALEQHGITVTVRDAAVSRELGEFDAYVIGGAAYMQHWLKDVTEYVRRHRATLATRPVWLYSSGPVGTETVDKEGRDIRTQSEPREFAEFAEAIHPRGTRVFFGAWDPTAKPANLAERIGIATLSRLPADAQAALPAGDFRDWEDIDAWARHIADALTPVPAG
jgi:menaquinone-dependent protoporphyrinogen oxidase